MPYYCEVCGHIGGHAQGCPEGPQDTPIYTCEWCGEEIFAGDTVFCLEAEGKYLCCECCSGPYEAEPPDDLGPDWDDIRKERLEREIE